MFDLGSRYANLPTATLTDRDGRAIAYVRRRFLPHGSVMPLLVEVRVAPGDRLDLIAARTLGDPEHFWRICDANDALDPWALIEEPGRALRVPVPQP
jgi:hypothetical protein